MNLSLEGKNAVICGSTQGIGLAVAEELALLGASCTLIARNETALKEAVHNLDIALRQQHGYLVADFSKPDEVAKVIQEHVKKTPVHILINNTGGPPPGPLLEATPENFLATYNQHLICNHLLMQAVVPGMQAAKYGRIINIVSTSVRVPLRNLGVSNTTRGAVASWAKTLSLELGPFNITVNNVLPGSTSTQRLDSLIKNTAKNKQTTAEAVADAMAEEVPLKRFADPSEVAAVAAFLATPAASYVSGVSIPVDGGRTGSI